MNPSPLPRPSSTPPVKDRLHPRNRHRQGYDFAALCQCAPALRAHLRPTPRGAPSIDFADPAAVKALNRALLIDAYGIRDWDIPHGYLCPPVPGRADYIHCLADLLAAEQGGVVPRGPGVRILDIGVGANCIYPILGHGEYAWSVLGVDCDGKALANAARIVAANPALAAAIDLRRQPNPEHVLRGILHRGERFDATLCNPPFHGSPAEAGAGTRRKWKALDRPADAGSRRRNFGGQGHELWCPGGERAFVTTLIDESRAIARRCLWFSSLLSRAENLRPVEAALQAAGVATWRVVPMAQGQKQSRLVAWSYLPERERRLWARSRPAATVVPAAPPIPGAGAC